MNLSAASQLNKFINNNWLFTLSLELDLPIQISFYLVFRQNYATDWSRASWTPIDDTATRSSDVIFFLPFKLAGARNLKSWSGVDFSLNKVIVTEVNNWICHTFFRNEAGDCFPRDIAIYNPEYQHRYKELIRNLEVFDVQSRWQNKWQGEIVTACKRCPLRPLGDIGGQNKIIPNINDQWFPPVFYSVYCVFRQPA